MKESRNSKRNRYFISALVVLILFVLPGISWFYLQSGLDYYKNSRSELKELGSLPSLQITNQQGRLVTRESLQGKIIMLNLLPGNLDSAKLPTNTIRKVHQSFNDTDKVLFLSVIRTDSINGLRTSAGLLGIDNPEQWYLAGANNTTWTELAANLQIVDPSNTIVLIDSKGIIRRYYFINQNKEMGKLVEHAAILLPKKRGNR